MIVKCVENHISKVAVSDDYYDLLRAVFGSTEKIDGLTVGKQYVVYAVEPLVNGSLYYLADDDFSGVRNYPFRYPHLFFSVVDSDPSIYWINAGESDGAIQAFAEWSLVSDFYERLVCGEAQAVEVFDRYRRLMDLEFPLPSVKDVAEHLEGAWLHCPYCGEAWTADTSQGMVQCLKCERIMRNPTYSRPPLPE